uniref:Uncharacterized protein n=1 Tax=Trypanosoma congolense (strain IL3000) TaxID=1068625 RepID=G0UNL0_TRYCI|nr:conserved hypothetical protein [Trypanosoma congolense IL3000]
MVNVVKSVSPLDKFVNSLDLYMQRVSIKHLLTGYCVNYSILCAAATFLVSASLVFPPERPLYSGFFSLALLSVCVLIIEGGLFRLSGGTVRQRSDQKEWLRENVQDILYFLLECALSIRALYVVVALELFSQLSNLLCIHTSVCLLCLIWLVWLMMQKNIRVKGSCH